MRQFLLLLAGELLDLKVLRLLELALLPGLLVRAQLPLELGDPQIRLSGTALPSHFESLSLFLEVRQSPLEVIDLILSTAQVSFELILLFAHLD